MEYKLSSEDQKIMERDMLHNRTLKHLKNISFYKFTIGDVLIREDQYHSGLNPIWKAKLADCGLPYKYVYVFENELGVGYIRRMSINGKKFVDTPVCVLEFDPSQTRFSLDPEYADHILLSPDEDGFDAKQRYNEIKKRREQIHRKNKKTRVKIDTIDEAIAFFKTLKLGDEIWYGHSLGSIGKNPYYIVGIHFDHLKELSTLEVSSIWPYKYGYRLQIPSLTRYSVFTTRPVFLDDTI